MCSYVKTAFYRNQTLFHNEIHVLGEIHLSYSDRVDTYQRVYLISLLHFTVPCMHACCRETCKRVSVKSKHTLQGFLYSLHSDMHRQFVLGHQEGWKSICLSWRSRTKRTKSCIRRRSPWRQMPCGNERKIEQVFPDRSSPASQCCMQQPWEKMDC